MATKRAELGYHGLFLPVLSETYGSRLEALSAQEKLDLVSGLVQWQAYDTQLQENGLEGGISLGVFLQEHRPIEESKDAYTALEMLADAGVEEVAALKLVIAVCQQLLEGVYSQ